MNNYNEFKQFLNKIDISCKPNLLIHACCAPCSTHVLIFLEKYFNITLLFYNPNIYPEEEFNSRVVDLKTFVKEIDLNINIIETSYIHEEFLEIAIGLEDCLEKGNRCDRCYYLRMEKTALYAKENNFDYFTTTLSISPHKKTQVINQIGSSLEEKYQIKYLYSDFKKENGYLKSIEYSRKYNLYRQDYCGCEFSKRDYVKK